MLKSIRLCFRSISITGALLLLSSTALAGSNPGKSSTTTIEPSKTTSVVAPTTTGSANSESTDSTASTTTHSTDPTSTHSIDPTTHTVVPTTSVPVPTVTPSPKPPAICNGYPSGSRKKYICDLYDNEHIKEIPKGQWTPAVTLDKEDTLYIIDDETIRVNAPLSIPKGSAVLSNPRYPDSLLEITFNPVTGTSDQCDFCALLYHEGSRVAGVRMDVSSDGLQTTGAASGKVKSIIYGENSASELSESVLVGDDECDSLIDQKHTGGEGVHYYSGNLLYANGSRNVIKAENSSDKAVKVTKEVFWHVRVKDSIHVLDGQIKSGAMQAGIAVTNLIPKISGVSTVYTPLTGDASYIRTGLYMLDVPRVNITGNYYAVSVVGYRRAWDAAETFAWKNLGKTRAVSFSNSYIANMIDVQGEDDKLQYAYENNKYYSDLSLNLEEKNILRFTPGGWQFHGSALRLNGTLQEYEEGGIVESIVSMGDMTGPAPGNGTAVMLEEMLAQCSKGCGWWDRNWKKGISATAIGGAAIGSIVTLVVLKFGKWVMHRLAKRRLTTAPSNEELLGEK